MFSVIITDLRKTRTKNTQTDMANILGVAKTTYSSYEQGKRMPDMEVQKKIAEYYGVSLDYLHGLTQKYSAPDWATQDDLIQLEDMLKSNVPMAYNGVELNEEDKERINAVLTQVFWERLKEQKEK